MKKDPIKTPRFSQGNKRLLFVLFIQAPIAIILTVLLWSCAPDRKNRAKAVEIANETKPRRIIFNWDGGMAYLDYDPLTKKKFSKYPISQDEFLGIVVKPWLGKQIDAIFYSIECNVYTTRMTTGEMYGQYSDSIKVPVGGFSGEWPRMVVSQCRKFWAEGTDDLEMVVREGHKEGLEIFASFRMNDTHFKREGGEIEWSKFNRDHPEFNLDGPRTAFDYAHQEVRDRMFAQIEEVCQKYDIDGIELDFLRYPEFFKQPAEEKAPLMTEFMGRIHEMLRKEGENRDRPILLAVRTMEHFKMSMSMGLDIREWIKRDWLDMIIAGGGYMMMDLPIEEMIEAARELSCQVYSCVNHYKPDPVTWAWAANAYAKGVDGLYLFNWGEQLSFDNINRPLLQEIGDSSNLIGKSKLFLAENRDIISKAARVNFCWDPVVPLPIVLSKDISKFPIRVSEHFKSGRKRPSVSLRLTVRELVKDASVTVFLNGHLLSEGKHPQTPVREELKTFETTIADTKLLISSVAAPTHEFIIDPQWLIYGMNKVEVKLEYRGNEKPADLTGAGILIDYSL